MKRKTKVIILGISLILIISIIFYLTIPSETVSHRYMRMIGEYDYREFLIFSFFSLVFITVIITYLLCIKIIKIFKTAEIMMEIMLKKFSSIQNY